MYNYLQFKNWKFGYKLVMGFGVIIIGVLVYAGYNLSALYRINANSQTIDYYMDRLQGLNNRHIDHLEWVNTLGGILITGASDTRDLEHDPRQCRFGQMFYSAERGEMETLLPDLKPLMAAMEQPHVRLHAAADSIAVLLGEGTSSARMAEVYQQEVETNMSQMTTLLHRAETLLEEEIAVLQVQSSDLKERVALLTLVLGVLVIVFVVMISVVMTRNIRKALQASIRLAEYIADGDLTVEIEVTQNDELGQLAGALSRMKAKLEELIGFMNMEAVNFEQVSRELSRASQTLSEGANEQASSLEEISSTMEEMNASVEQNSAHANATRQVSEQALTDMEEVNVRSVKAFEANTLIAQRIAVISDIVFQTNILALNASVEAARAGEHGKGFAVVAGEVRKLADKSKEAADEIMKAVKEGLELTQSSMERLQELVPQVGKTAEYLSEIAAAGIEQSNGSNQVNMALQELNTLTQQSAGSSEELSATAQHLESRARQLRDLTAYFKINRKDVFAPGEDEQEALSCPINGRL